MSLMKAHEYRDAMLTKNSTSSIMTIKKWTPNGDALIEENHFIYPNFNHPEINLVNKNRVKPA
mgnify:CR=1 FL=1